MRRTTKMPSIDDLTEHDPQRVADKCCIPVVWVDHQATRRQKLHGVNLPRREDAYTSTHMNEILEHLAHEGFVDAILITETPRRKHLACYIEFQPLIDR